jgi:hypothetical protein
MAECYKQAAPNGAIGQWKEEDVVQSHAMTPRHLNWLKQEPQTLKTEFVLPVQSGIFLHFLGLTPLIAGL